MQMYAGGDVPADGLPNGLLAWMQFLNQAEDVDQRRGVDNDRDENINNGNIDHHEDDHDVLNENIAGNMDNQPVDHNNENSEDADAVGPAWVEVGIAALPGGSRKRSREEDEEDVEEESPKRFRFWDEFTYTFGSDTDSTESDCSYSRFTTGNFPARHTGAHAVDFRVTQDKEEDSHLSGNSRKRLIEEDEEVAQERSSKCFRSWEESAHSFCSNTNSTESVSGYSQDTTGNSPTNHAGASAVDFRNTQGKEGNDRWSGPSRKRSREEDGEVIEERSSKCCRIWEEFAWSSDSNTDSTKSDGSNTRDTTEGTSVVVAKEDSPPDRPRKRSRKCNNIEDRSSS